MFGLNFNKAPQSAPAEKGPSPKETDPEVLSLLEQKTRHIADTAANQEQFTNEEIHKMALILAEHAENQGTPLTKETVESPEFESRIIDALDARHKMRSDSASKMFVAPEAGGHVVGQAKDMKEAREIIQEDRENRESRI